MYIYIKHRTTAPPTPMSETFKKGREPRHKAARPPPSSYTSSSSSSSSTSSPSKPKTWQYKSGEGGGESVETYGTTILLGLVALGVYYFICERRRDRRFSLPRLRAHPEPFHSLSEVQHAIRQEVWR